MIFLVSRQYLRHDLQRVVPALPGRDVMVSLVMRSDRDVTTCQPRVPGVHGTSITSASRRHVCHTRWGVTSVGGALVFLSRPRSQTHVVTIVSDDSSQRLTSSNRWHMFIEVLLCQPQALAPTLSLSLSLPARIPDPWLPTPTPSFASNIHLTS